MTFSGLLYKISIFLKTITVEPVAFFNFLSFHLFSVAQHAGLYEIICLQLFQNTTFNKNRFLNATQNHHINYSTPVNCRRLADNPSAEIMVQKKLSEFNIYLALVHILPAMVAHVILGAWGDRCGRKYNILIGIFGLIINILPYAVLFEFPNYIPLWMLLITGFFAGCTGYIGLIMISSYAYLADVISDKEKLTSRMVVYSLVMSISGVIGSLLAANYVQNIKFSHVTLISAGLLIVSFIYSMIRLEQTPPVQDDKIDNDCDAYCKDATKISNKTTCDKLDQKIGLYKRAKLLLNDSWLLLKSIRLTYTKPRNGKYRLYLILIAVVYCLYLFAQMAFHVTGLYVYRYPISWQAKQLGYWRACANVIHMAGNLSGILIMKNCFELKDTTIMMLALLSQMCQEILMGLSKSGSTLYVALGFGALGPLFMPTVKSYVAQIVDANEVGKSFIMFGLAHDIGSALSSVLSNAIYKITLTYFPGFIYLFCSGFFFVGFTIILYIHLNSLRRRNNINIAVIDGKTPFPDLYCRKDNF